MVFRFRGFAAWGFLVPDLADFVSDVDLCEATLDPAALSLPSALLWFWLIDFLRFRFLFFLVGSSRCSIGLGCASFVLAGSVVATFDSFFLFRVLLFLFAKPSFLGADSVGVKLLAVAFKAWLGMSVPLVDAIVPNRSIFVRVRFTTTKIIVYSLYERIIVILTSTSKASFFTSFVFGLNKNSYR